jgi:hypothetical protein
MCTPPQFFSKLSSLPSAGPFSNDLSAMGEVVKLLWTGGWDSTYRLLDLVLLQGREVQPIYVLHHKRESTPIELATMDRIRSAIRACGRGNLVRPTRHIVRREIQGRLEFRKAYKRLNSKKQLGGQYEWLAYVAEQEGLFDLELAIHVDDLAFEHIKDNLRVDRDAEVLVDDPSPPDLKLFRYYRFPILRLTKQEMQVRAIAGGFLPIMEHSWFCHTPDAKGSPCGTCNPCMFTIQEGMGRRVPWRGHLRFHVRQARGHLRKLALLVGF